MERPRRRRNAVTVSLLVVALTGGMMSGCMQRVRMSEESGLAQFKFIRIGKSDRQEFYNRLGKPVSEYEDGRIIIYRLVPDVHGGLRIAQTERRVEDVYNLVLVFGPNGVLERNSLVRVR